MMNSLAIQQHPAVDVNMSKLTSASGEASASSGNIYQQSFATPNPTTMKKKRNLPGNPGHFLILSDLQVFLVFNLL